MQINVIDVSTWQKNVDFVKVKNDGIQGVIIRAGFGWDEPKQKDNMFESHYKNAKAAGLKIGAYHYSYATNKQQATREAYTFMDYIKGKEFDYPVFYDVEDAVQSKLSGDQIAEIMVTFGDILEGNGYYIGMYSYVSMMKKIPYEKIKRFTLWVAQYYSVLQYPHYAAMWQYTSTGKVDGYSGNIDKNYLYEDYAQIIKDRGGNPVKKVAVESDSDKLKKAIEQISKLENENNLQKEKLNKIAEILK